MGRTRDVRYDKMLEAVCGFAQLLDLELYCEGKRIMLTMVMCLAHVELHIIPIMPFKIMYTLQLYSKSSP